MKTAKPQWKGIVLAGGKGTRLYPITMACSKQLLPVYDKPMVYYPISTLVRGGIRDILIISTPQDLPRFRGLLGDGARVGLNFAYVEQSEPHGIAEALLLGEEFVGSSSVCLILGDNLFHGDMEFIRRGLDRGRGATIFGYPVSNPERYGVVELDSNGRAVSIEEKPKQPKSHLAVPGLYCYDNRAAGFARELKPSGRGEFEITDLNRRYLRAGELHVEILGRGIAWLDMGTPEGLLEAGSFVRAIEHRQGMMIGCIEEAAYEGGFITAAQLFELAGDLEGTAYGDYLKCVAGGDCR